MRITNDDYKPSLLSEEELEHYGIKGMKWGVRRTEAQLARARGKVGDANKRRKARDTEIKEARGRIGKKKAHVNLKRMGGVHPLSTSEERKKSRAKASELKIDMMKDPDRITASRMTSGQKAMTGLKTLGVVSTPAGLLTAAALTTMELGARELATMGVKADVEKRNK